MEVWFFYSEHKKLYSPVLFIYKFIQHAYNQQSIETTTQYITNLIERQLKV